MKNKGFGEEYNVEKGNGKQNHLPYNIKAAGKNIKWGKGLKMRGRKSRFKKNWVGKNIKL